MDNQTLIKRLKYRSWHRGCKETDLILGNFAEEKLETLPPELLSAYTSLLDEDDADIWAWLTDKYAPEKPEYLPLIEILKSYGIPSN